MIAAALGILAALIPFIVEILQDRRSPQHNKEVALEEFHKGLASNDVIALSAQLSREFDGVRARQAGGGDRPGQP